MPRARRLTILVLILVFVLGIFWLVVGYGWFLQKQERVANGVANPKFPYRDYTLEELNTMYPQYLNVDVPTTQTPEQTHRLFLTALKEGDIDKAVECCVVKSKQKEMREGLIRVAEKEQLQLMISDLDTSIKVRLESDDRSSYSYTTKSSNLTSFLEFLNDNGKWLINSL